MLADRTFANEMWWGPIGVDARRLVFHGVLDAHALWQMEPHALGRPFGRLGDHLLDKRFGLVGLSEDLCVVRQAWCQFVEVGEFDVFQAMGVEFATVAFGVREVVEDGDFLEVEGLCGGGLKGMDSADLTGLELVGVGHCGAVVVVVVTPAGGAIVFTQQLALATVIVFTQQLVLGYR